MTHGFDDQGRKYDATGVLRDWWTEDDGKEYEKRADVMVQQAEEFEVHGMKLKGKLTCGENIADLGGLKLAHRALEKMVGSDQMDVLPAKNSSTEHNFSSTSTTTSSLFTPRQKLFFSWARVWAQNSQKERELMLVTVDPHGPNELRVNGTVSNMTEFQTAFGFDAAMFGDKKLIRQAENMVDIW